MPGAPSAASSWAVTVRATKEDSSIDMWPWSRASTLVARSAGARSMAEDVDTLGPAGASYHLDPPAQLSGERAHAVAQGVVVDGIDVGEAGVAKMPLDHVPGRAVVPVAVDEEDRGLVDGSVYVAAGPG